jgi:hypothetical protein
LGSPRQKFITCLVRFQIGGLHDWHSKIDGGDWRAWRALLCRLTPNRLTKTADCRLLKQT